MNFGQMLDVLCFIVYGVAGVIALINQEVIAGLLLLIISAVYKVVIELGEITERLGK